MRFATKDKSTRNDREKAQNTKANKKDYMLK